MHSVTDALESIRQNSSPLAPVSLPLDQALNCILAAPVKMDIDAPPFHRAMVDGYAVRSADIIASDPANPLPTPLQKVGHQDAGGPLHITLLQPGQCLAINTGAPVPPGADAVVMIEDTSAATDAALLKNPSLNKDTIFIHLQKPLRPGANIQPQAADAAKNSTVLDVGTLLGPAQLAVAAAAGSGGGAEESGGAQGISVIPQPRVALLVTGDELVPSSQLPGPGQIRNSNSPLLTALLQQSRVPITYNHTSPDDAPTLRAYLLAALQAADLLLITGGMSMGTKDLIPPLLLQLGFTLHIEKIKIRPGKPMLFGTLTPPSPPSTSLSTQTKYVIGLPGNPVSAFVCYHRFVRLLLARLAALPEPQSAYAPLAAPTSPNTDREFYQPALLENGSLLPLNWKGSADIFTLAKANALLILPPNSPAQPATTLIPYLPL